MYVTSTLLAGFNKSIVLKGFRDVFEKAAKSRNKTALVRSSGLANLCGFA